MTPDQIRSFLTLEGWEQVVFFISLNSIGLKKGDYAIWISDREGRVNSWGDNLGSAGSVDGSYIAHVHILQVTILDELLCELYQGLIDRGWV